MLVLETRFRAKSVRMISGKAAEYKLFLIGNEKGYGFGYGLRKRKGKRFLSFVQL